MLLEEELQKLGRINPENPNDWQPTPEEGDGTNQDPDPNVVADAVESFESRSAVEVELENRLILVKGALEKIEKGEFGSCATCGAEIEEDRLGANPAAETCKEHMNG